MKYTPFWGCMVSIKYPQFEASIRKTVDKLGIELGDVEGFTCCPDPIYYQAKDKMEWLTIAGRNLAVAEAAGRDVITCCSGCTSTLSEANHILKEDSELRDKVNQHLKKVGKEFKGTIQVRHIVTAIRDDIGIDKVAETVTRPLKGLRVGIHYGCHLLKPSAIMQVDDPDHPAILADLVRATGAEPVEHKLRLLCCGKACMSDDIPDRMVIDLIESIEAEKADCMGLICPTCFDEFDLGQIILNRKYQKGFQLPVIYYFQLLGLAQGLEPKELGLHFHKIKAGRVTEKVAAA